MHGRVHTNARTHTQSQYPKKSKQDPAFILFYRVSGSQQVHACMNAWMHMPLPLRNMLNNVAEMDTTTPTKQQWLCRTFLEPQSNKQNFHVS